MNGQPERIRSPQGVESQGVSVQLVVTRRPIAHQPFHLGGDYSGFNKQGLPFGFRGNREFLCKFFERLLKLCVLALSVPIMHPSIVRLCFLLPIGRCRNTASRFS